MSQLNQVNRDDCWLYASTLSTLGYGVIYRTYNKKKVGFRAHRLMYEAYKGRIPKGLVIDHLCRVRHCVNPEHLEAVTHKVNILRGISLSAINAQKTQCLRGHEYSETNTYILKGRCGAKNRRCKTCVKNKYRSVISHSL